jgi:hypothetical protein
MNVVSMATMIMMTIFRMIKLINMGSLTLVIIILNQTDDAHKHDGNYGYDRGNTTDEVDSTLLHTSTKGTTMV